MIATLAALAVITAGALLTLALGLCRMAGRPAPLPPAEEHQAPHAVPERGPRP